MGKVLDHDSLIKELEDLKHSRQIWLQNDHERFLTLCGFKRRESHGSSPHITYVNHEHKKSFSYVPYHKSNDGYQLNREVANVCLEVLGIKRQRAFAKQQPRLNETFTVNGNGHIKPHLIPNNLPRHIIVEEKDGSLILRHERFKCLGAITRIKPTSGELADIGTRIKEEVAAFARTLDRLKKKYNLTAEWDENGDLVVYQPTYKLGHVFRSYSPTDELTAINHLEQFGIMIEGYDQSYTTHISEIIEKAKATKMANSRTLPDGQIEWTVKRAHFINDQNRDFKFTTSQDGRIQPNNFFALRDAVFEFEFGNPRNRKYLQDILKQHYGFVVERPYIYGTRALGNTLKIYHPLFEELTCEIPVPSEMQRMEPLWKRYMESQDPQEEKQLKEELEAVDKQREYLWGTLNALLDCFRDITVEHCQKSTEYLGLHGPLFTMISEPKNSLPGEYFNLVFYRQGKRAAEIPTVKISVVENGNKSDGEIINYNTLRAALDPVIVRHDQESKLYNASMIISLSNDHLPGTKLPQPALPKSLNKHQKNGDKNKPQRIETPKTRLEEMMASANTTPWPGF